MWDWHQKLQKRLKSEITEVINKEEKICESVVPDSVSKLIQVRHTS